ncbi:MAG: S1C family serine protease [Planctomycetes bacterium]|nr:S1C family serine protease [Planctomycetota bacterium]
MNKIALSLALLVGLSATAVQLAQDAPKSKAIGVNFTSAPAVPIHKALEKHRVETAAKVASHIVSVEVDYDRDDVPAAQPSFPGLPGNDEGDPFFRYDIGPFTGLVVGAHHILISDRCLGDFSKDGASEAVLRITVTLPNGNRWPATVVGRHQQIDLALLEVDCDIIKDCPVMNPVEFDAASEKLTTGQQIIVVGRGQNPLGTLVNDGIVSAIDRENGRAFQIDARIGNSTLGAPVVDRSGDLIGMVTLHNHKRFGQASGVSYAAYMHEIRDAYELLKEGQFIERPPAPFMGVQAQKKYTDKPGLEVANVIEGTGAARAGLTIGDIILKVNDTDMVEMEDLLTIIQKAKVGDVLKVIVLRSEEQIELKITLGAR